MKTKFIFSIALFSIFAFNQLSAGCGSCAADKKKTSKAFIEMIPSSGKINGKAFASCGMCNFDTGDRSCGVSLNLLFYFFYIVNRSSCCQADAQ
jgi:hypothetical protein